MIVSRVSVYFSDSTQGVYGFDVSLEGLLLNFGQGWWMGGRAIMSDEHDEERVSKYFTYLNPAHIISLEEVQE